MLKEIILVILLFTMPFTYAEQARKNVLFIGIDDLKPLLGCYGYEHMHTPNIDRLASMGTTFLNNHCQVALCGPSRNSIMTGTYPDTANVFTMGHLIDDLRKRIPGVKTLPGYFKENGYYSYGVGKLFDGRNTGPGQDRDSWSNKGGVEWKWNSSLYRAPVMEYQNEENRLKLTKVTQDLKKNKIKGKAKMMYFRENHDLKPVIEVSEDVPDEAYNAGNFMAPLTIKQLRKRGKVFHESGEGFFIAVGFYKPHLPFVCPKKYYDLYKDEDFSLAPVQGYPKDVHDIVKAPINESAEFGPIPKDRATDPVMQIKMQRAYAACISYVDAQIGKIFKTLDEEKLWGSTVVCLWGDHGFHLGDKGFFGKHTNYEEATRSPLILYSPDIKGGVTVESEPTEHVDMFPTICELAGLEKPKVLDGDSLVSLMRGEAPKTSGVALSQYLRFPDKSKKDDMVMGYALRDDRYRYVEWRESKRDRPSKTWNTSGEVVFYELYDYQKDATESVNLASNPEYEQILKKMRTMFDQKMAYLPQRSFKK